MDLVLKNFVNFDDEYNFLENFKLKKVLEILSKISEDADILDKIAEVNKNDLML